MEHDVPDMSIALIDTFINGQRYAGEMKQWGNTWYVAALFVGNDGRPFVIVSIKAHRLSAESGARLRQRYQRYGFDVVVRLGPLHCRTTPSFDEWEQQGRMLPYRKPNEKKIWRKRNRTNE